ncbi:unnamed protein product [Toxocara canis]|uniref:Uncharacterized protein n=1 Tax=Toxocara canis TaxID=6265 RepID=A0A183TXH7_TOXCA|nr:unnamed protein product [Toxocara canis]
MIIAAPRDQPLSPGNCRNSQPGDQCQDKFLWTTLIFHVQNYASLIWARIGLAMSYEWMSPERSYTTRPVGTSEKLI